MHLLDSLSPLQQAVVISGAIFVAVMLTAYGRRPWSFREAMLRPLVLVLVVGALYLRDTPVDTGGELAAYAVAVGLGLVFGLAATAATRLEREDGGRVSTVTGAWFVAVWVVAVACRLVFIATVEHVGSAQDWFASFLTDHRISPDAVAPFFVTWAVVMVLSRLGVLVLRARSLEHGSRAVVEDAL
jgi:lysylphosphatidylglycerol synthetase-like protein (DUF2156 family)